MINALLPKGVAAADVVKVFERGERMSLGDCTQSILCIMEERPGEEPRLVKFSIGPAAAYIYVKEGDSAHVPVQIKPPHVFVVGSDTLYYRKGGEEHRVLVSGALRLVDHNPPYVRS